jgi:hypothetical protein
MPKRRIANAILSAAPPASAAEMLKALRTSVKKPAVAAASMPVALASSRVGRSNARLSAALNPSSANVWSVRAASSAEKPRMVAVTSNAALWKRSISSAASPARAPARAMASSNSAAWTASAAAVPMMATPAPAMASPTLRSFSCPSMKLWVASSAFSSRLPKALSTRPMTPEARSFAVNTKPRPSWFSAMGQRLRPRRAACSISRASLRRWSPRRSISQ